MNTTLSKTIDKLPLTRVDKTNLKAGLEDLVNGGGSSSNLIKVTYKELKALRDNSQLVPGRWYRMTDYECIVAPSAEYKSAGHQFDLILLATDTNKLSESCKAARHEGDTYFPEDTNFEAWEVKYCLDNDNSRFNWACKEGTYVSSHVKIELGDLGSYDEDIIVILDSTEDTTVPGFPYKISTTIQGITVSPYLDTIEGSSYNLFLELPEGIMPPGYPNPIGPFPQPYPISIIDIEDGKGVVYELKDERNNRCGYDFKNILFTVNKLKNDTLIDCFKNNPHAFITDFLNYASEEEKYLMKNYSGWFTSDHDTPGFELDKKVDLYTFSSYDGVNDIIIDMSLNINKLAPIMENDLGLKSFSLTSTIIVQNKLAEKGVDGLTIKSSNKNTGNVINGNCHAVTIDENFAYNTVFGNISDSNIGRECRNNIIAGDIVNVTIGHHFYENYIKAYIKNIITGSQFIDNFVEDYIAISTLGNNIANCRFKGTGNGGSIHRATINNLLNYVVFEKPVYSCIIENDVQDVHFYESTNNCVVKSGICGNTSTHKTPIEVRVSLANKYVAKNSKGQIIVYNPADSAPDSAIIN